MSPDETERTDGLRISDLTFSRGLFQFYSAVKSDYIASYGVDSETDRNYERASRSFEEAKNVFLNIRNPVINKGRVEATTLFIDYIGMVRNASLVGPIKRKIQQELKQGQ